MVKSKLILRELFKQAFIILWITELLTDEFEPELVGHGMTEFQKE